MRIFSEFGPLKCRSFGQGDFDRKWCVLRRRVLAEVTSIVAVNDGDDFRVGMIDKGRRLY